ncbi:hypothetical protein LBMAG53_32390 [Planctomycetota bacterium]|nr:hypothetical protein LBMAG53_32390 [Planctomycetota bacterium]
MTGVRPSEPGHRGNAKGTVIVLEHQPLSQEQLDHFIQFGFVKVPGALDQAFAKDWVERAWVRLGYDPADPATWRETKVHMPGANQCDVREAAPRAYAAICQLCGGEDRVQHPLTWSDAFIANFALEADRWQPATAEAGGWHKDGDFFLHFLDSPEQGLLTIILWNDVVHRGGPTYLAADSVGVMARFLAEHPEGVNPLAHEQPEHGPGFPLHELVGQCRDFREATGSAGDVYLMHPYILHASSANPLRRPRFITNPPILLREPMRFDRSGRDGDVHSPVELAVLRGLGRERFTFTPTRPRQGIVPPRLADFARRLAEEKARGLA